MIIYFVGLISVLNPGSNVPIYVLCLTFSNEVVKKRWNLAADTNYKRDERRNIGQDAIA